MLITPKDLKALIPLSEKARLFVQNSRQTLVNILEKRDRRLLIIVGPCSIHHVEEALDYAIKLKELAEELQDSALIVMRSYIEKPRTVVGWKGLVHDPHLNGSDDIDCGLRISREFLVELAELGVPAATEFLTPYLCPYIEDLISWGSIGARTSTSQIHRLLASDLSMPVGFKNSVDGNVDSAIFGALFAARGHQFLKIDDSGRLQKHKSRGNPHCHVVLRGSETAVNFDPHSIQQTANRLRENELVPRILVDCSHGNSKRTYFEQEKALQSVMNQLQSEASPICGVMLESHLEEGCQSIPSDLSDLQPGVSITDSCLGYPETAALLRSLASSMSMSLTKS